MMGVRNLLMMIKSTVRGRACNLRQVSYSGGEEIIIQKWGLPWCVFEKREGGRGGLAGQEGFFFFKKKKNLTCFSFAGLAS